MRRPLNIALVAEEAAGIQVLRRILAREDRLVAVLADETPREASTVAAAARAAGVRVSPPELVRDPGFAATIRAGSVDLLLNVHSLVVVHPEVLAAPRIGSFNLHPGPLPQLAGLNSPSWAIYLGERRHGVTLHWMTATIDAGPIAYSDSIAVTEDETGLSLSLKCVRAGLPLVDQLLAAAGADGANVPAAPQVGVRRYFGAGPPHGGWAPWDLPAERLAALVRACDYRPFRSPWPHPKAIHAGIEIAIVDAAATAEPTREPAGTVGCVRDDGVFVAAADRWLRVSLVEVGCRALAPQEVLKSGDRLVSP
jgi:methionyl-tRNA formyltransferase